VPKPIAKAVIGAPPARKARKEGEDIQHFASAFKLLSTTHTVPSKGVYYVVATSFDFALTTATTAYVEVWVVFTCHHPQDLCVLITKLNNLHWPE